MIEKLDSADAKAHTLLSSHRDFLTNGIYQQRGINQIIRQTLMKQSKCPPNNRSTVKANIYKLMHDMISQRQTPGSDPPMIVLGQCGHWVVGHIGEKYTSYTFISKIHLNDICKVFWTYYVHYTSLYAFTKCGLQRHQLMLKRKWPTCKVSDSGYM